jgi:hypothetical protein
MPGLSGLFLRRAGSSGDEGVRCSGCRRTPLVGERLHEMRTGRMLCELCVAALPEHRRRPVRTELVHAGERHVAVAHRAA